jgi:hypothetical protein
MDLTQLSTPDLLALQSGDLTKVSTAGLQALHAQSQDPLTKPEDPGLLQSALIGAGRTTDRIVKGVKQAYYAATSPWAPENAAKLDELQQSATADNKAYAPLQQMHPFATGVGEAVPSMVVPMGGSATLMGNAARMAFAGALPGALEYGSLGERGSRAAWGAAAGAAVPLTVSAVKTTKALLEPTYEAGQRTILSRLLNRAAGDEASDVAARLSGSTELVPGSLPTAAQVAENGGISALERSASAVNPQAYTARAMQQANARAAALGSIAQTPEALADAIKSRKDITKPLYDAALSQTVESSQDLKSVLQRLPGSIWNKASNLAQLDTGTALSVAKDAPAGIKVVTDASGVPMLQDVAGQAGSYSAKALHYLKLALDDTISTGPQVGIGSVEQGLTNNVRSNLLGQLDQNVPGYQAARNTYSAMSEPINQMQVGQAFYNKMVPPLRDLGARTGETSAKYAGFMRDSSGLVQDATGMGGKTLEDVMSPQQMSTLTAVGQDLARKANAENLGRGVGSDTVQKLAMSNVINQAGFGKLGESALNIPAIHSIVQMVYPSANDEMAKKLAQVLLNPKAAADLMQRTSPKLLADNPRLRNAFAQLLMRPGLAIAPVAANAAQMSSQP